jgi:N-methylhydantoinase A
VTDTSSLRFAIDTGGTFTDIVVVDEATGHFAIEKASTTPQDTLIGVMNAIDKAGVDLTKVNGFFVHGSTTALNAMLERKGVKTAFVTTRGFRDVPEIMRYNRPEMYNPKYRKPVQIVPRTLRYEVTERLNVKGEILTPLVEDEVRTVAAQLRAGEVKAVAVCLIHGFRNPVHERRIRDILREELPEIAVAISSEVAPEHREFERGITTILNAYLAPVVERWIGNLERELERRGFGGEVVLTKSDGGGMSGAAAKRSPINMLLSGPSGGVIGGLHMAEATGHANLVTMDVGGTSFDIAAIRDGRANVQQETRACGFPVLISNLDIRTIGAGCGSIAWIDDGGALHVGPQSAGAMPGPICYQRGGTMPTVTDAFLANGFIDPANFLGGQMELDSGSVLSAIEEQVATPLGLAPIQASSGMLRIVMSNMAEAVKDMLSEVGDDPRDFTMLCFGGGGPMFGAYLMDELRMPAAIVPVVPSTFSAFGMLMVDVRHDVTEAVSGSLRAIGAADLEARYRALEIEGLGRLAHEAVPEERRSVARVAEMRYEGQEHSVSVDLDAGFAEAEIFAAFETAYEKVFGYRLGIGAEIVNLRVRAVGAIPKPAVREIGRGDRSPSQAVKGVRPIHDFMDQVWLDWTVYDRGRLLAGNVVEGPALIEEATTTTVVRGGQRCDVDSRGNLIITRPAKA